MNNFQKILLYFCITSVLIIIIPLFLMVNSLTYNSGDAGFSYIVANVDLVIVLLYCLLTFLNTIAAKQGTQSSVAPSVAVPFEGGVFPSPPPRHLAHECYQGRDFRPGRPASDLPRAQHCRSMSWRIHLHWRRGTFAGGLRPSGTVTTGLTGKQPYNKHLQFDLLVHIQTDA